VGLHEEVKVQSIEVPEVPVVPVEVSDFPVPLGRLWGVEGRRLEQVGELAAYPKALRKAIRIEDHWKAEWCFASGGSSGLEKGTRIRIGGVAAGVVVRAELVDAVACPGAGAEDLTLTC